MSLKCLLELLLCNSGVTKRFNCLLCGLETIKLRGFRWSRDQLKVRRAKHESQVRQVPCSQQKWFVVAKSRARFLLLQHLLKMRDRVVAHCLEEKKR